ncbi:hypothetical protein SCHPADRAFT_799776, partial [Schizopora paradoxa]
FQRVFKHAIKRAAHADLVDEALKHLNNDGRPEDLKFDTSLPTLRDRSVAWIVQAYRKLNDPSVIRKCFEMCKLESDSACNLSYASLTSKTAMNALCDLPKTDP